MKTWNGFEHGINLGGWLSQCVHTSGHYSTFIGEKDFQIIAGWGLDHVRIPVDYNLVETPDGEYLEEGFRYIEKAIFWCKKNGLNMVLDLHKTYGYSFDSDERESGLFENEKLQERFYRLWEQFAQRYSAYSDMLAFELLNEVTDRRYSDAWNHIARECIRRIRNISADICILIGGYYNNSIDALPDLEAPYDSNIIYNFHCYDPLLMTHQGAPWVKKMDTSFRFSFNRPAGDLDRLNREIFGEGIMDFDRIDLKKPLNTNYFECRFEKAVRIADDRNVRLYCGEYGMIDRATPDDTVKWYQCIHDAFEKYGIGRAAWTYKKMDFGLSDARLESVRKELISLL